MAWVCPASISEISDRGSTSRLQWVGLWLSNIWNILSVPCMACGKSANWEKGGSPSFSTPMRLCCHLCDEGCHAHCSAVSIPLLSAAGLNSPDWRFLLSGFASDSMSHSHGCRGWSILRPVRIVGRVFLGNHPVHGSAGSRGHR